MFTRIQSRASVVLSLGLVSIGNSLHGQSVTPADTASQDNKIELSYHVKAIKRDSSGQYTMSGTVSGERQGKATLVFGFDEGSSGEAGKALIHSYWVVTAVPASESFKAKLVEPSRWSRVKPTWSARSPKAPTRGVGSRPPAGCSTSDPTARSVTSTAT